MNWPNVKPCADNARCNARPIDIETITFSGASDPAPPDIIGNIPHLRCCCASMTDIQAKYKDPNATTRLPRTSSWTKGSLRPSRPSIGRIDTWVTMHYD